MDPELLYTKALGLTPPWAVDDIDLVLIRFMVTPHVDLDVANGRLSPRDWLVHGLNPEPDLEAARTNVDKE